MSNRQLIFLVAALLAAHLAVLVLALLRRGPPVALWLTAADAAAVLGWQALHPRAFRAPVDWPVVALAGFEVLVLAVVVLAGRGGRLAGAAVCVAFALHLVASGLAVVFALTFRITRLI